MSASAMSGTPRLVIHLLGAPVIEIDGRAVELDTRKAVALVAYLALTGERQTRDTVATLLWPEYDQQRSRASLRRTLSVLKAALGDYGLDIEREALALDPAADVWIDVRAFRARLAECRRHGHAPDEPCPACLAPLQAGLDLYRGDFMAGFTLRDSPEFDQWQYAQGEALRRELAGALKHIIACYRAQQDFEHAVAYARRWLALDPLHEPAHRQLMQLFAQAGQRNEAVRQYRECVRILGSELGVAPLEDTTALYGQILRGLPGEPQAHTAHAPDGLGTVDAAPPPPRARTPAQPPLVGRAAEWAVLWAAYQATGPDGRLVVIQGEAGIGKTRLAEDFLAAVGQRGATVIPVRCYEGQAHLAYGPVAEALRAALNRPPDAARWQAVPTHGLSEAARLVPELARWAPDLPQPAPLEGPGAQSRFLEGLSQTLLALCGTSPPGVLFFDDLHWADEATLDLLTYLVRRLPGRPVCVLVTWRDEQVPVGHRLQALLAEAQRATAGFVVTPGRLDEAAVQELVGAYPAGSVELARRLYRETEGLPFFVVEYLTMLDSEPGGAGPARTHWPMPVSVRDLLRSRLAAADETGRQLLQTAAVIGRSLDFETLREASGRGEEETVTALEELTGQGLIQEVQADHPVYDFSHEKLRALVYEDTSLARRRLLHRRVAEALAGRLRGAGARAARPETAAQIAYHYRLAGQDALAADFFKLAGDHARGVFANAEALGHYQAAVALGHPAVAAIQEALGDLYTLAGAYESAILRYETAAAHVDRAGASRLEHKLGNVYARRGVWDTADRYFQAAQAAWESEAAGAMDEARARLLADRSRNAHHRGRPEEALALAQQALSVAERGGDQQTLAQVHNILGMLARRRGDLAAARQHLERSLGLAEPLPDPSARIAALNNLALVHATGHDLARGLALLEVACELCRAQGDRHREAALHNNTADLLHAAGRQDAAMVHLKQAVTIYAEIGTGADTWQPEIWKLTEW